MIHHFYRIFLTCFLFFFIVLGTRSQSAGLHTVYLLGNTAQQDMKPAYYTRLQQEINRQTGPFTIIHLGDIAAGSGWAKEPAPQEMARVSQLLDLVKNRENGKIIFVPGDKDWDNSGRDGLKGVRRLEKYIAEQLPYKNGFVPGNGCPGPEVLDISDELRIIAINSQWWMHPYLKPESPSTDCKILTGHDFAEELEEAIEEAENRNILVVGHHPVLSHGVYSGRMPVKKHIFPLSDFGSANMIPLPIIGSIYAAYRQNIGTPRDMANNRYEAYIKQMKRIFSENPGLVYASAHEYSQQLLQVGNTYQVISGSLTRQEPVGKGKETLFKSNKAGFAKLEYYTDGSVISRFISVAGPETAELASFTLYRSPCLTSPDKAIPENFYYTPCPEPELAVNLDAGPAQTGKTTVIPGEMYEVSAVRALFFGKLYRSTWLTPVTVPYLDLHHTHGGLHPIGRGGGRQTTSIKFDAGNGQRYVFRSVDKNAILALPPKLRETFASEVIRDITATGQPFGALVASSLLDSTDILHARPRVYVMPDDPALGAYREDYAGMLGMLEERPVKPRKGFVPFAGADDVPRTPTLFRKLYNDNDNQVDAYAFAKARAFDIWVGDFGRHDDNWRWAGYDQNGKTIYKPVPRDRDHVFSRWNGILPWFADREWVVPSIQNFSYDFEGIRSLNFPARHLDRALLQQLNRQDWQDVATYLQQTMTEATIDSAIAAQPAEVIPVSGYEIAGKLKNRIKHLPEAIDKYYLDLAMMVDVVGSNKNEYFKVERLPDGKVRVQQFKKDKETDGPKGELLFDRTFVPGETKEIRIFALGGKDVVEITGSSRNSILVRVIGGEGKDIIKDDSQVSGKRKMTKIYDTSDTELDLGPTSRNLTSDKVGVNVYDRHDFRYNYWRVLPTLIYNRSDGLGVSGTVTFGRYQFREPEVKRIYNLNLRATQNGAFVVTGSTIRNNVVGTWGLGAEASYGSYYPFYNFFGLGNNTSKDDELFDDLYYRARYKGLQTNFFTHTRFLRKSYLQVGGLYEYLNSGPEAGTILGEPGAHNVVSGRENLAGGRATLDFDLRDNQTFTRRGLRFFLEHSTYQRLSKEKNTFGLTEGSVQYFGTARLLIPVTLALKAGGAKNYGENLPFYKFTSLGIRQNLRGYVNNRFFGDQSAYLNSELRFHLGQFKTPFAPFYYGLISFYDQGKVWYKGTAEGGWHRGYGGGFYLAPVEERFALSVLVGHSKEENVLLQFSVGFVLDR